MHFCQIVEALSILSYRELYQLLEAFSLLFKYANTSNTRSISVLPNRLMNKIIEAFSELGNNIGRNWTII